MRKKTYITEKKWTLSWLQQFFLSIMAPSFFQYKYYSSFITEHGLALQNFSSCVVKIIQSHAELPVVASERQ